MMWKDEYAPGIRKIDVQHKPLLEFITELFRHSIESDRPFARCALGQGGDQGGIDGE